MPTLLKRTLVFEFSMYVFEPEKHAEQGRVDKDRWRRDGELKEEREAEYDGVESAV